MGSDNSKGLTPTQVDDLKYCTAFSSKEIRDWYEKFHLDCPSGKMTKENFITMYNELFPDGDAKSFAKHVFDAYDIDKNGFIDFREFLCTISVGSRGTIDEKLKWAFNMYDLDGNGYVTKSEVHEILRAITSSNRKPIVEIKTPDKYKGRTMAIYKMKGNVGIPEESGYVTPDETVDKLFAALDKNRDDKLSDLEFIIGAKAAPEIMGILQATHTPDTE